MNRVYLNYRSLVKFQYILIFVIYYMFYLFSWFDCFYITVKSLSILTDKCDFLTRVI
ncbi:hypothetical protein C2G38_117572 [Gigaspora rosea]|uniref:Uncharacterized protein n=1 Tax=Gigaspora rosea TaxID=44941 RepID=A0A397UM50_9GLOM|nr:hypothetical protein C2G38_117572 [Gigaspora rosea]